MTPSASGPAVVENAEGVVFTAKIVPGSSRTVVAGVLGDMIKIRVAAAPEKGKANECLIAYLAQELGVKKNAIEIVSGHTNPVKQVKVAGVSTAQLLERLGLGP
ncbi:MAG: DUF167 domain-containing protein [Planctomycetes bacterium]|nr:DUF167 domain-containing protein [Planctomycetota bacterium]